MTALVLALSALLIAPIPTVTPGATRPLSTAQVCSVAWGKDARHVTESMKRRVFASYGIPLADRRQYEVDHLIPRELGGADDVLNLWPQPWVATRNAHQKDRLENTLHVLVCTGKLSLGDAQQSIRRDWIAAYARYLGQT